jgi:hypothetical protein
MNGKSVVYQGADKSLARPGRKQTRKHVRDSRDFNKIETPPVIKFLSLQAKLPKEIRSILTETLACSLSGRATALPALLYCRLEILLLLNIEVIYLIGHDAV